MVQVKTNTQLVMKRMKAMTIEKQSADETDSEDEDIAEKGQNWSEEGTK